MHAVLESASAWRYLPSLSALTLSIRVETVKRRATSSQVSSHALARLGYLEYLLEPPELAGADHAVHAPQAEGPVHVADRRVHRHDAIQLPAQWAQRPGIRLLLAPRYPVYASKTD